MTCGVVVELEIPANYLLAQLIPEKTMLRLRTRRNVGKLGEFEDKIRHHNILFFFLPF